MSSITSIAIGGLNAASARLDQASSNIVNASSTGGGQADLATAAISLSEAGTSYQTNIAVLKVDQRLNQDLVNILA